MASESAARKEAEQEGPGTDDEAGYPDDADVEEGGDEKGKAAAYAAWKTREFLRLSRDAVSDKV